MIECLILGDSIAVGVGAVTVCSTVAEIGINSSAFIRKYGSSYIADQVIISLGSNDYNDPTEYIDQLRGDTIAKEVIWLVPKRNKKAIIHIARKYGDKVIMLKDVEMSPDGIHPTYKGYNSIKNAIK